MASSSQLGQHIPAIIKGHRHYSYGGAILPDQNIIKVPIPKEHPYQSHISRFALFPTYRTPNEPNAGVRAPHQRSLNPLVPASDSQVTVLRKTKGGPYRHEELQAPMETRKTTNTWSGQHGLQDHLQPVTGEVEAQMFYPTAQDTGLPDTSLRVWGVSRSERTANKSPWATSYQLHFTGRETNDLLRTDDFHEKSIGMITEKMTPNSAQPKERSHSVLLPPKLASGHKSRIRPGRHVPGRTRLLPAVNPAAESIPSAVTSQHDASGPLGVLSGYHGHHETLANDLTQDRNELSYEDIHHRMNPSYTESEESPQVSAARQIAPNAQNYPSGSVSNPGIRPRSPVLPSTQPGEEGGGQGGGGNASNRGHQSSLLELQDSFSKSEVHRRFHSSLRGAPVNLQDNVHTGRRHRFLGFHSYYYHN
ncbi:hypothetical protein DPEC_G00140090 [Dallia pectoralis]|uniref:Uncharacterized protein n=1 Tax=Dallia pectoralis TaxID=75939 RepID=A0ACC2GME1_DALPE|nr:hypothetical protein DPEC_G00140090 [Dallia pectoralis]